MAYVGDYNLSTTFHHRFTTVNGSGLPTTLGNTPSAEYYVDGGATAFTAGLALTADFNSKTGLNSLEVICTSSASGLTSGVNVSVQIAAGTVSGVSVVGYPIIEYSITRRSPLRPTTAGRTITVDANGVVAANVTSASVDVGAIVTAVSTIVPARVTAQGIDVGAIVTAFNTIAPANVTAISTVAPARVTAMAASGLAALFLTNSGTTYAAAVTGSPVKETADNAGGSALTVTSIAAGVWDEDATGHQTQGTFGQTVGDSAADSTTLYAAVTSIKSKVTALTFTSANRVDANIKAVADVTVTGFGTVGNTWGP